MTLEDALQFADEWTKGQTFYEGAQGWRVVCAVLAAEVRRLQSVEAVPSTIKCKDCLDTGEQLGVYGRIKCGCQSKAVEAVPVGYALANLDGTIRNHGDGELMVYRNPFSRSDKTDCIPLYMHPPSLDDETKKLQNLLSENARLSILNHLYEQISAGREEFSAMDMDYWDSSHDKLLEAIQNKLDDDTRKLVLELCESLSSGEILSLDDANTFLRSMYVKAKNIREKLGAGDE